MSSPDTPRPAAVGRSGAYAGLRVLDLSQVIAGPFCTRLLSDLGADVIRVESPSGDVMRALPVAHGVDGSSAFAQYNAGKRSLGLNLKSTEGRDIAERLVAWADVVVENFRPGALEQFGLGWEKLQELNPRVVLLSLSLFGRTGAYSHLSGHGMVAEAYSGLMSIAGEEGGPPSHFGTPLADLNAGVHALAALGAALHLRERTGMGSHVDVSSFDALFAMIDQAVGQAVLTDGERDFGRYGSKHPQTVPTGVVRVASGEHVTFSAVGDAAWSRLAIAMGRGALASDPRFVNIEGRVAHRGDLYGLIDEWAAEQPDAEALIAVLQEHGLPGARVRTVAENRADPHLIERGTLQPVDLDGVGEVLVQSAPYRISGTHVGPPSGPPRIGQHTDEVLRDLLHLDASAIRRLHHAGAVHGSTS